MSVSDLRDTISPNGASTEDDAPLECPLCLEELDATDRNFKPCKCGYQVCLWCWHSIKEELKGRCPACRTQYEDQNIQFTAPDPETLQRQLIAQKEKAKKKKAEKRNGGGPAMPVPAVPILPAVPAMASSSSVAASPKFAAPLPPPSATPPPIFANVMPAAPATPPSPSQLGRDASGVIGGVMASQKQRNIGLEDVRVLQHNLVYVVGLSPSIAREEVLRKREFFGRFGRILKVSVNRKVVAQGGALPTLGNDGASASAYITFKRARDAAEAIKTFHGQVVENRTIRATFGTTKYCSFFLRHASWCVPPARAASV